MAFDRIADKLEKDLDLKLFLAAVSEEEGQSRSFKSTSKIKLTTDVTSNKFGAAVAPVGGLPQSDSAGGSGCEAVRAVVGVYARELNNDVETLANCVPRGGVLEFDLPDVVLEDAVKLRSPITIEGCFLNSIEGLIHVQNSTNVTLEKVEFEGNENIGGGPAGLSAAPSGFRLLNVKAINNTGSWGGVIAALNNSEATILDSKVTRNVALESGGAIFQCHN
ncbi:hypothetical protein BSKO_06919 [Bryopsis sp. KO-2023]|nr:hypothetical protein BSKO_06919 [Bryopsis sp. KO-2023]